MDGCLKGGPVLREPAYDPIQRWWDYRGWHIGSEAGVWIIYGPSGAARGVASRFQAAVRRIDRRVSHD